MTDSARPARRRIGVVLRWSLLVVLGLVLGLGSAAYVLLGRTWGSGGTTIGAWTVNTEVGDDDSGLYVRGVTATQGLLALTKQEALYFVAERDDAGRALDADCTYELGGGDLPATWWSITAYDGAYLADNTDGRPSVDATSIERSADGSWTARLSTTQGSAADWISTRNNDDLNLLLRLYVPEESVLEDPASVDVPTVERLSCGAGA